MNLIYDRLFERYHCRQLPPGIVERMIKDRKVRVAICKEDFSIFFHFYFAHYVKYQTAPFQHELLRLAGSSGTQNLFVTAFRGSGKSTIFTMAYPIWSILGTQQKKFVLILCQTRSQAKQHMMNLKRELEGNQLLRSDLGPFKEENDEWGSSSLVFSKLGARITAASSEQSIRGLRHNEYRPDLLICDDVEDMASVKTREGRDKTHNWLRGEVIPAGDRSTRLVVVGNLLHEDSLMMRLKQDVEENLLDGVFKSYRLIDEAGVIAWPGKYPAQADIEAEKRKVGSDVAWQREYLLRIVSDSGRVVHPEWIHYYESGEIPFTWRQLNCIYVGVDLAVSQKETADCTAIVALEIYSQGDSCKAYVRPFPLNQRLTFPEQIRAIKDLAIGLSEDKWPEIFIEKVGYQEALPQQLRSDGLHVESVPVSGDKRERLMVTTAAIQNGDILFPRKGCEELITQLTGFGVEKHDDLADAFSIAATKFVIFMNLPRPSIEWI
jgi:predicted phage terminase large subunit-like protein